MTAHGTVPDRALRWRVQSYGGAWFLVQMTTDGHLASWAGPYHTHRAAVERLEAIHTEYKALTGRELEPRPYRPVSRAWVDEALAWLLIAVVIALIVGIGVMLA